MNTTSLSELSYGPGTHQREPVSEHSAVKHPAVETHVGGWRYQEPLFDLAPRFRRCGLWDWSAQAESSIVMLTLPPHSSHGSSFLPVDRASPLWPR
jgi:hypothetical protein